MSGPLNCALDAGDRLRAQRHFTETEATREAFTEFRRTTDPFSVWLDENTVLAADGLIPQMQLRAKYKESCEKAGRALPSAMAITSLLKSIRSGVELKQKNMNEAELRFHQVRGTTAPWCYFGIAWLAPDLEGANSNRDSGQWSSKYESYN